jgi:hypothetical protein
MTKQPNIDSLRALLVQPAITPEELEARLEQEEEIRVWQRRRERQQRLLHQILRMRKKQSGGERDNDATLD